jgi:hypothetical protein
MVVVYGVLGCFALYRMMVRPADPEIEQGEFVLLAPRATAVAATAIAEDWDTTDAAAEVGELADEHPAQA